MADQYYIRDKKKYAEAKKLGDSWKKLVDETEKKALDIIRTGDIRSLDTEEIEDTVKSRFDSMKEPLIFWDEYDYKIIKSGRTRFISCRDALGAADGAVNIDTAFIIKAKDEGEFTVVDDAGNEVGLEELLKFMGERRDR